MDVSSGKTHALSDYWASYLIQISSGNCTYDQSLKMLEKWTVPCTTPVSTWFSMLSFTFSQTKLKMEYCHYIWEGVAQFTLSSHNRDQKLLCVLVGGKLVSTMQPISHRWDVASFSLIYCYFSWKVLEWTAFLSFTSSNLHGQDPACHLHCSKPPSFSPYSIGEE